MINQMQLEKAILINTPNFDVKYLTLSCGANFKVLNIIQTENYILEIDLLRYSKSKGGNIESRLVVKADGYYLPNGETSSSDVISISDGVVTLNTPVGVIHKSRETQNINLGELNVNTKIQTRNGNWYNCTGAFFNNQGGLYMLRLAMVSFDSRVRNIQYTSDGKHVTDYLESFSQYDIMRIEQLG